MCLVKIILLCGFILLNKTIFLITASEKFNDKIQVLIKDSAKNNNNAVFKYNPQLENSANFTTFLSLQNVVIDRSMFIELVIDKFVKTNLRFIITSPSRWGKSTLQDMVRFFFSIQLENNLKPMDPKKTDAFHYFHEGKIKVNGKWQKFDKKPLLFQKTTNKAKLEEHLANHPVISIDLFNVYYRGGSVEKFENKLKRLIWEEYIVHERKLDAICSRKEELDIADLCNFRQQAINLQLDPSMALNILTRLLYIAYQERKIVLLIDEFDTVPLEDYISVDDNYKPYIPKNEVKQAYKQFMLELLKEPKTFGTMYLFVYITGILPISFDGVSATDTKYINYLSPKLTPFFGIDNSTANDLMNMAKFNDKDKIGSVCDGYETPHFPEVTIYNPYSLLEFLRNTTESYPWFRISRARFLSNGILPKNKDAVKKLIFLIGGECIGYSYNEEQSFTFPDLSILQKHMMCWQNNPTEEKFLTYLLYVGILTLSTTDKDGTGPWTLQTVNKQMRNCVKVANKENRLIIQEQIQIRAIDEVDVIKTSEKLAEILSQPKLSLNTFEERVQSFMAHSDNTNNLIYGSELFYHGLFFFDIVRYLGQRYNYKYFVDYKFLNMKDNKTPDIVIYNNSYGAVFEIKYNNKPLQISDAKKGQLRKYGLLFHDAYPEVENLRLILIHIEEDEKRTIMVKVTGLDPITSEEDFAKLQQDFNSYNT